MIKFFAHPCIASQRTASRIVKKIMVSSLFAFFVLLVTVSAHAAGPYQIGSGNTVTADPNIARPSTTPCVVNLFQGLMFVDFSVPTFSYTPPASCPGPWQKVVMSGDFSVTAGVQFDRTANVWLGGSNIYFGTTSEPMSNLGPSWHVENDLTDYTPLFLVPQTGEVSIGNIVDSTYTGIIIGTVNLEFYPATANAPVNQPFDAVLPLSASSLGGTVALNTGTDSLSQTFTLPKNIEAAYLDVYAQSQSSDEFWYTCVPNDVSTELQSCGGTPFRETEVSIDGQPAGVAPVSPWIFTGGIDPYLWSPIPGAQTLNFAPYRVNLTPFAGVLSDGNPHTVAVNVFNANSYFSATANLLLRLDPASTQITGAVTSNTLASPVPVVAENLTNLNGNVIGTVGVTSNRKFAISGYATGAHGTVTTTLNQTENFASTEAFNITGSKYQQNITQTTTVQTSVQTTNGVVSRTVQDEQRYPLSVDILFALNPDFSSFQTTTSQQHFKRALSVRQSAGAAYTNSSNNFVSTADTLLFDASGNLTGNQGQAESQRYFFQDSNGQCFERALSAANNVLTGFKNGCQQ